HFALLRSRPAPISRESAGRGANPGRCRLPARARADTDPARGESFLENPGPTRLVFYPASRPRVLVRPTATPRATPPARRSLWTIALKLSPPQPGFRPV